MATFEKYESSRIAGASAFQWVTRTTRMIFVVLASVVLAIVIGTVGYRLPDSSAAKQPLSIVGQILIYVFFAALLTFFVSGIRSRQVESAEKARGYSTLPLQEAAVDVVDAKTGLVIRLAHEPPLKTRQDIDRARNAARSRAHEATT